MKFGQLPKEIGESFRRGLARWTLVQGLKEFGRKEFSGLNVSAQTVENRLQSRELVGKAVALIAAVAPETLDWIKHDVKLIVIGEYKTMRYEPAFNALLLKARIVDESTAWVASVIVYYGAIAHFHRDKKYLTKDETVAAGVYALEAQLTFARRLPDAEDIVFHLEKQAGKSGK